MRSISRAVEESADIVAFAAHWTGLDSSTS